MKYDFFVRTFFFLGAVRPNSRIHWLVSMHCQMCSLNSRNKQKKKVKHFRNWNDSSLQLRLNCNLYTVTYNLTTSCTTPQCNCVLLCCALLKCKFQLFSFPLGAAWAEQSVYVSMLFPLGSESTIWGEVCFLFPFRQNDVIFSIYCNERVRERKSWKTPRPVVFYTYFVWILKHCDTAKKGKCLWIVVLNLMLNGTLD